MSKLDFDIRIGNLGVRSCKDNLLSDGEHTTAELIEWFGPNYKTCYVIAYWKKGKEGYDLTFVGDRPFGSKVQADTFFKLAELGQSELGRYFKEASE